jgi:leucyl aminopeptidase
MESVGTMQMVPPIPAIAPTAAPVQSIATDLVVLPLFDGELLPEEAAVDAASGGEIGAARDRGEITGRAYEVFVTALRGWGAGRVALVGAGTRADCTTDRLRRLATTAGHAARQRRVSRLAIVLDHPPALPVEDMAQALAEGIVLANFDGASYKTRPQPVPVWLTDGQVKVAGAGAEVAAGAARGRVLGQYTNVARNLANEPSNVLTPRAFAEEAVRIATGAGLGVEVLDEQRITELKMGLLLGVAKGSQEPPRLVVLRYEPANARPDRVLGLVGKGITFDTGGISIKPAELMDRMKDDMSGGAAVLCAMAAIATIGARVRCIGLIPLTENMPGGRAFKPGDVLISAEGKTVEILNTDAEGRLVLGDAVWYARQLGATHLVDVATLTGACVVALGKSATGLFGTPDAWRSTVLAATERAGDRAWPMPLFDDYKDLFKSEIADFANTGGRAGGAITGAMFIQEFSGGLPWAHLDIAGTAWVEDAKPYQVKGASGVAVRTLAELALAADRWTTA